jgi:hypothetical protein
MTFVLRAHRPRDEISGEEQPTVYKKHRRETLSYDSLHHSQVTSASVSLRNCIEGVVDLTESDGDCSMDVPDSTITVPSRAPSAPVAQSRCAHIAEARLIREQQDAEYEDALHHDRAAPTAVALSAAASSATAPSAATIPALPTLPAGLSAPASLTHAPCGYRGSRMVDMQPSAGLVAFRVRGLGTATWSVLVSLDLPVRQVYEIVERGLGASTPLQLRTRAAQSSALSNLLPRDSDLPLRVALQGLGLLQSSRLMWLTQ